MGESVREYYIQGLAPSTTRAYKSAKSRFIDFCVSCNQPPIPVTENLLCFYTAKLADEGLAHSSIKAYLSAIRHLQISGGYPDPRVGDMPRLSQVMRGIKSKQAKQGRQSRPRLPITPSILRQMRQVWVQSGEDFNHIMLWAASTTCFFGFMRAGEITVPSQGAYDPSAHLSFNDIAVNDPTDPTLMEIRVKASKTDPFRNGVNLYVGRTNNELCPIAAMTAYLAIRGGSEGPLFRFENGRSLTRERFVAKVREALAAAGINHTKYAGHSFRIGAASTAARCGIADSTIQLLGRWESSAYLLYIRTPRDTLAALSTALSRSPA